MAASVAELKKRGLNAVVGGDALAAALGHTTYAGDPTSNLTPDFIGQECLDTSNNAWYKAHGTAAADWKKLTP